MPQRKVTFNISYFELFPENSELVINQ
jgi:hypothetical protein